MKRVKKKTKARGDRTKCGWILATLGRRSVGYLLLGLVLVLGSALAATTLRADDEDVKAVPRGADVRVAVGAEEAPGVLVTVRGYRYRRPPYRYDYRYRAPYGYYRYPPRRGYYYYYPPRRGPYRYEYRRHYRVPSDRYFYYGGPGVRFGFSF
jgi:hypothetical protein